MHSFINRNQTPLTIDEIARRAPSALATRPYDAMSAKYTYVPTLGVIEAMIAAGFQPFSATQSRTRVPGKGDFTKHLIRFRHQDVAQSLVVGAVIPEVVLINSHDGTSAYKLIAQTQNSLGTVQGWTQLQLTDGEQHAFAESAHTLRFADADGKVTTPITADQLLTPRRREDVGNDLWRTFNRVQENVISGGLSAVQRGRGRSSHSPSLDAPDQWHRPGCSAQQGVVESRREDGRSESEGHSVRRRGSCAGCLTRVW